MKHFWLLSASLVLIGALQGAEQKTKEPPAKARPFHGTIKTVNKAAQAIVLNGAKAQTFKITSETKIRRDGKPIRFEDIAAGESVGGYAHQAPAGQWEAITCPCAETNPEAKGEVVSLRRYGLRRQSEAATAL